MSDPSQPVNVPVSERYFEDVNVGDELPALVKRPTAIQIFRYSAVTWNAHRIHFERDYALQEGHPDMEPSSRRWSRIGQDRAVGC